MSNIPTHSSLVKYSTPVLVSIQPTKGLKYVCTNALFLYMQCLCNVCACILYIHIHMHIIRCLYILHIHHCMLHCTEFRAGHTRAPAHTSAVEAKGHG